MQIAFSSLACPGWSVERIAGAAQRYGYAGIEWRLADGALLGPRTEDGVWRRIARCGVPSVCLDTSAVFVNADDERRAKAVEHAVAMAERAAEIGAPCARVFGGPIPDAHERDDVIERTRDCLWEAASRSPVELLVETHDAWSKGADVVRLTRGMEVVGVVWDIAHTFRAGEEAEETLRHVGLPKLVHAKDAVGERLVQIGEGEVPLSRAIEALRHLDYKGFISFEWEKLWHPELADPDDALAEGSAALRSML